MHHSTSIEKWDDKDAFHCVSVFLEFGISVTFTVEVYGKG